MSEESAASPAEALRTLRHDLRTPVNHITGYAELLLEDARDTAPALVPGLEEIVAAAPRALALIDELSGQVAGQQRPYQPRPAAEALAALAGQVAARSAELELAAEASLAPDLQKIGAAARQLADMVAATFAAPPPAAQEDDVALHAVVLIVDDNDLNRDMLSRRVERLGYRVAFAANGVEALAVLGRERIDVVLLDIMMPELDGYGVLERRQADARLREIPVIVISAVDEIESVARCLTLGAEDYLPKPFNPVLLKARLDATLERKRRRDRELAAQRDVARLTDAAAAIEAGSFALDTLADLAARPDPLGRLAAVLVTMAGAVQEREAQLRAQVKERSYVFLSYARADAERAGAISEALEKAGVRVWVDRHDIAAGTQWSAAIVQSIRNCQALLIACSPAAMASRNVRQEIQLAWKYNRPYVPLILEQTAFPDEMEYQLEGCQWIDVYDRPAADWLPSLQEALGTLNETAN